MTKKVSVDQTEQDPSQQGQRVSTSPAKGGVEQEGVTKPQELLFQGPV